MTGTVQRAVSAVRCLVSFYCLLKPRACFSCTCTDKIHLLSHWTDITVALLVIEKFTSSKRMLAVVVVVLLFIKHAVLYKSDRFLLFKQSIVFFGAIPGIGNKNNRGFAKTGLVLFQMSG